MKKVITLSLLLFGVIFLAGCGQQQANQNQPTNDIPAPVVQQPAQPTVNENQNVNTNQPAAEIAKVSVQDIRNAFAKKYPTRDYSKTTITIEKNYQDLYVEGLVGSESGAHYWAAKVNGSWIIVQETQDAPLCSLFKPYNFPADMISNCYEAKAPATTATAKVTIQDIRNAFTKKYPTRDNSSATITIDKNYQDLYVDGGISGGAGGAHYWAAKVNGSWIIVQETQDAPLCSLFKPYNFPADMTNNCY